MTRLAHQGWARTTEVLCHDRDFSVAIEKKKKKGPHGIEASQVLYEDNVVCIAQVKGIYIKGDQTKYISPKFFYTHELQNSGDINVQQIRSSDNLADLFTKALSTTTFKKLVHQIGMRQVKDLQNEVLCHYQGKNC